MPPRSMAVQEPFQVDELDVVSVARGDDQLRIEPLG